MTIAQIIGKKKRGQALTSAEIEEMVAGFLAGRVSEGQMAAFLMAVCWQGMDLEETTAMTMAMARSGEMLDLSQFRCCADKHSSGGVGDKTTLVACPIAAAAGVTVAKMSGRSLGHTGGTIDKLEAIPGLRTDLSPDEFLRQAREIGLVIASHSPNMVPADKAIYALRDATGTVASIPLIASSIMSKKIAVGAPAVVLDVKYGRGAFMKDWVAAGRLAAEMGAIGKHAGRRVATIVTPMDQPLGRAVGNALEVAEAVEVLSGAGPPDVRELSLMLASMMIFLSGRAASGEEGRRVAEQALQFGAAREKFLAMVEAQGGDAENLLGGRSLGEGPSLPVAPVVRWVRADREGYVTAIDSQMIGETASVLAARGKSPSERANPGAGIVLYAKMGDYVRGGAPGPAQARSWPTAGDSLRSGDVLAAVHAGDEGTAEEAARRVAGAITIGKEAPAPFKTGHDWMIWVPEEQSS